MSRAPRKPMVPGLSDKDRATMKTTASESGLSPASKEDVADRPDDQVAQAPVKDRQAGSAPNVKGIRTSIAPSSDLAAAVQDAIGSLSADAQRFAQPAALLRSFLQEHDRELAKLFRDSNSRRR